MNNLAIISAAEAIFIRLTSGETVLTQECTVAEAKRVHGYLGMAISAAEAGYDVRPSLESLISNVKAKKPA